MFGPKQTESTILHVEQREVKLAPDRLEMEL